MQIQGVDIYDRCPSLGVDLVPILDCYMDVAGDRNMDGNLAWHHVYRWCAFFGLEDPEFVLGVIRIADSKVAEWRNARSG